MSVNYCGRCKVAGCPGYDRSDACENPPRSWEQAATASVGKAIKPWLTPMEAEWPTITAWVRTQTVSTEALRTELQRALDWLDESSPEPNPYHPSAPCVFDAKGQCTTPLVQHQ